MSEKYVIEALARGLFVLSQFDQDHRAMTLTELVERTQLNKATLFRILNTLENAGYLERDPETRSYRPGIKVLNLGFTALSGLDVRQVARPYLEKLAEKLQLTVSLSVLDGRYVIYVDRIRNRDIVGVILGLGSRIPAHCASMGKVMLAYLTPEECTRRLAQEPLEACTAHTMVEVAELQAQLVTIREHGVAFNIDELALGLRAVAAPIHGHSGEVVAAINVSGSSAIISVEQLKTTLAQEVKQTAHQISQLLT